MEKFKEGFLKTAGIFGTSKAIGAVVNRIGTTAPKLNKARQIANQLTKMKKAGVDPKRIQKSINKAYKK